MTKQKYSYHKTSGVPLKLWDSHGQFDEGAMDQLRNVASLPFIHKHVAGMPDVHWGMGATIGSVIATKGVIIPAAVGVDIGCGMMAVKLSLEASDLPDNLHQIRCDIEEAIPHGRTDNGGSNDKGSWHEVISPSANYRWNTLSSRYTDIVLKHPKAKAYNTSNHMGTLGTGNHFIEVCLDEYEHVWVMLHSGSRGVGNKIGTYFINEAKKEMERYHIDKFLPDQNLSYVVEHTELFDDYVNAVGWAQEFALQNRLSMMETILEMLGRKFNFSIVDEAINCHHNYIARESHFGANVWVTRKGAVRARKKDLGIIPGSMGTGSFIVRGLGNKDSFCSCSHGAGRVMSRGQAKKEISLEQHAKAMIGIEARLDKDVLDESPSAYKDIGAVMNAQDDLVEVVHRLKQIINVKG